jgi:fructose-1,6-bisphosphatase/inositol monophosphatase family enzyme
MVSRISADLEALFRLSAAVHATYRQAARSPKRAEVVAMGADGSPTESLDRIAETRLLAALDAEGLDWNLLSEEAGIIDRGGTRTLVVDPIDGSHNALRGLPFSTVSLALGSDTLDGIEAGVVHDLSNGSTYWAGRGTGAFCDGRRIRVRRWEPKSELFFINLGRHSTPRASALAVHGRRVRSLGCASLEMVLVAQGGADAYLFENERPERNLRVTDIAAAYRIVTEAGGGVVDALGASLMQFPLALGRRTSVLAFGDPAFPDAARREGYL